VTIPYTVAVATIAIKATRMAGGMDATRSLTSTIGPLGVVRIEFQDQKWTSGRSLGGPREVALSYILP
jgi:hypothetical protein